VLFGIIDEAYPLLLMLEGPYYDSELMRDDLIPEDLRMFSGGIKLIP